jgi:hypothetical protein
MLLVDHPSSLGGNVFQRPAEVNGVQAETGQGSLARYPLEPIAIPGTFFGWIRSGAARKGTGGPLTNAFPQILRDGVKQMQVLKRRGPRSAIGTP